MKRRSPGDYRHRPLQLEFLESRIVPSALNVTLGGTATTLIESGDTGDAGATTILDVSSGAALVFVTDLNSNGRSEEHTSELQSQSNLVCRLLLEKKK